MIRNLLPTLVLLPALAACGGSKGAVAPDGPPGDGGAAAVRPTGPLADPLAALPASGAVARYTGPFAREARVLAFQRDAGAIVEAATLRLREETGLAFTEGRGPLLVLADGAEVPASGAVSLRLADGVRRPEIRIPAAAVASGEFRARETLPGLVAEAALVAATPERAPPEWILRGLPAVFAGDLDRRAAELVVGGPAVRPEASALAPLEPAFRVAALRRIGTGERVLSRFVSARLAGTGDTQALRDVGVGSADFLDAAAATETDRALERVLEDPRVVPLRDVRAALAREDLAAADAALARVPDASAENPWMDAEMRLVRAEASLLRGDAVAAIAVLDEVLARPESVVRLRDARFLRALAALGADDPTARARAAEFARTWILDPRSRAVLADLGVAPQDALEMMSGDPALRARAAGRIAESGKPSASPWVARFLRDGEATVRKAAAAALAKLGAADAAADLDAACQDPDGGVRGAALAALAKVDPPRGLRRARDLASDPDAAVASSAAALVRAAEPKPEPPPAKKPAAPPAPKAADAPASPPRAAPTSPPAPVPVPARPPKGVPEVPVPKPASSYRTPGSVEPPDSPPPPPAPRTPEPPRTGPGPAKPPAADPAKPPAPVPPPPSESPPKPPAPIPPPKR